MVRIISPDTASLRRFKVLTQTEEGTEALKRGIESSSFHLMRETAMLHNVVYQLYAARRWCTLLVLVARETEYWGSSAKRVSVGLERGCHISDALPKNVIWKRDSGAWWSAGGIPDLILEFQW